MDQMGPAIVNEDWLKGTRSNLEANLTQTYFYYAQVYSQQQQADKGIEYSCKTMQRQLDTGTHNLKEFVLNCIHLSDYFNQKMMYA